VHWKLPRSWNS